MSEFHNYHTLPFNNRLIEKALLWFCKSPYFSQAIFFAGRSARFDSTHSNNQPWNSFQYVGSERTNGLMIEASSSADLPTYPVPWNGRTVATGRSKASHCLRNSASSTLVSVGGLIRRSKPALAWSAVVPLAESPVRSTPPLLDEYNMMEPAV